MNEVMKFIVSELLKEFMNVVSSTQTLDELKALSLALVGNLEKHMGLNESSAVEAPVKASVVPE